jgi:hypothetical protein
MLTARTSLTEIKSLLATLKWPLTTLKRHFVRIKRHFYSAEEALYGANQEDTSQRVCPRVRSERQVNRFNNLEKHILNYGM